MRGDQYSSRLRRSEQLRVQGRPGEELGTPAGPKSERLDCQSCISRYRSRGTRRLESPELEEAGTNLAAAGCAGREREQKMVAQVAAEEFDC